jgi:hypothetical protein
MMAEAVVLSSRLFYWKHIHVGSNFGLGWFFHLFCVREEMLASTLVIDYALLFTLVGEYIRLSGLGCVKRSGGQHWFKAVHRYKLHNC